MRCYNKLTFEKIVKFVLYVTKLTQRNLPAHDRNVAMIPILLARNLASLSSLLDGVGVESNKLNV